MKNGSTPLSFSLSVLKLNRVLLKRAVATLLIACVVLVLSAAPIFGAVSQAQAQRGFPLYTWGINDAGQLGRVPDASNPADEPVRMEHGGTGWVDSAAASGGSFALSSQGYLYSWGNAWTSAQMAQGAHPSPGTGNILFPERVGNRSDWREVFARGNNMAAISTAGHLYTWGNNASNVLGRTGAANIPGRVSIERNWAQFATGNSSSFAITTGGTLYSWGAGTGGVLGQGDTTARSVPTRIENRYCSVAGLYPSPSDWKHVATNGSSVLAITTGGALYAWGNNVTGQLGIGETGGNRHVPTRVGARNDWADIAKSSSSAAVISNAGNLYTFGSSAAGRLGNGGVPAGNVNTPAQIGSGTTWAAVMGSGNHFMAFTTGGALYAWGDNAHGQLGIGETGGNRNVPTFVAQTFGRAETPRGGGLHSNMLMRLVPAEGDFYLTKALQKPYGTPRPTLTFSFSMVANSFNNNPDSAAIDANFPISPTLDSRNITRTITIGDTSASNMVTTPAGNIVELTSSIDLLEDIVFERRGVYSWIISELPITNPAVTAPSSVVFSQAQYELRVYVRQRDVIGEEFYIYAITLHRLRDENGVVLNPPVKVGMNDEAELSFTNTYTRRTAANQHLNVHKYIEGLFADLSETFTFTATINRTALCTANTINARIYRGTTFVETITFTFGQPRANITLGHNYRLVFDPLVIGSTFEVVEAACPLHIASVRVYSHAHPTTPLLLENTLPDQPRTTNTHIVGANTNAANFRNVHQFSPPTGLFLGTSTYIVMPLFAAGIITAASLAAKARRRIEDMPLMH